MKAPRHLRRRIVRLVLAGLAAVATTACGGREPTNVVLVTIDTIRADHFGCEGHPGARTPNIDQFAATGDYFWHCTCPVPITLPSHTSILTGTDPIYHGVHDNGLFRVAPENETIAEILAANGYSTAAFVSGYPLTRRFGIDQGFATFDDDLASDDFYSWTKAAQPESANQMAERPADVTTRAAVSWLEGAREPFFLWIHYFDPHHSHEPPPPYDDIFFDRLYDGEIAFVDEQFGRVLDTIGALGVGARTAIIVTGDHGEGLGDHGEDTHAMLTYDATLRVPLMAHLPGVTDGHRSIDEPVGVIDIVPTILDLIDVPAPDQVQGISLLPLLSGEPVAPRALYFETHAGYNIFGWAKIHGIRSEGWKLIRSTRDQLYHVAEDPGELRDLAKERPDQISRLAAGLDGLKRLHAGPQSIHEASRMMPSDQTQELLAALGYLSASTPDHVAAPITDLEPGFEPDRVHPQDFVWVINEWSRLREDISADRLVLAESRVRYLLDYDPSNPDFRNIQAMIFARTGREQEAEGIWESLVADGVDRVNVLQNLGLLYSRTDRPSKALELFEAGLPKAAGDPTVHGWLLLNIAEARARLGDVDGAVGALDELAASRPYDPEPLRREAALLYRQGQLDTAADLLERAVAINPYHERSQQNLAAVLVDLGRPADALVHARRAVDLRPEYPEARYILAVALIEEGRYDEAHELLTDLVATIRTGSVADQSRRLLAEVERRRGEG